MRSVLLSHLPQVTAKVTYTMDDADTNLGAGGLHFHQYQQEEINGLRCTFCDSQMGSHRDMKCVFISLNES